MWAAVVIQLLTAIFKAVPSMENLVKVALERADKAHAAAALLRKESKDRLVDKAINEGVGNDCEND